MSRECAYYSKNYLRKNFHFLGLVISVWKGYMRFFEATMHAIAATMCPLSATANDVSDFA